jgi:hypothetical protein
LCFVQLRGQIHQHLLQDLGIMWQAIRINWHYRNYKANATQDQAQNASIANIYAASTLLR